MSCSQKSCFREDLGKISERLREVFGKLPGQVLPHAHCATGDAGGAARVWLPCLTAGHASPAVRSDTFRPAVRPAALRPDAFRTTAFRPDVPAQGCQSEGRKGRRKLGRKASCLHQAEGVRPVRSAPVRQSARSPFQASMDRLVM